MIVEIIVWGFTVIMFGVILWCVISMYYYYLEFKLKIKSFNEIHDENVKRIEEGNSNNLIDYNIVNDEPSPYWVIRVNQKLGLW